MPVDPADYRPSLADLGGIMRARTRDTEGDELGTFTEDTRPSDTEAEGVIDLALGLVTPRLGIVPDDARNMGGMAKTIVALRAAILVESSYFPEEAQGDESAYAAYRDQYREALADYDAAIDRDVGDVQTKTASVGMKSATKLAEEQAAAAQP